MLRPEKIVQELTEFNRKLASGIGMLAQVGEIDVGASEKDPVLQMDKLVLYRFRPRVEQPLKVPVLVVYALVNRPYMADLQHDRSMIRGLLDQGLDVYLVDWGYPDGADRYLNLDDYLNGYLRRCVDFICRQHEVPSLNLLGICQGGTFSLCFSAMHPEKVRNLVTMVTPVDFHTPDNVLGRWAQELDVDLMVDTLGNVPGELLNWCFLSLKPFRLTGQKYLDMTEVLEDPVKLKNFLRMEKWIFDSPDQAGEAYREFITLFYKENRLVKGGLTIGDHPVDPASVTMPVFNVYATEDHLVPPASSLALESVIGTRDYTTMAFKGGHIGIYVSGRAQKEIPKGVADWLRARMN